MKLVGPSECDMERVKNIKASELIAVKLAERFLNGLNSIDPCSTLWQSDEKVSVASKAGAIAVGPIALAEGVAAILGSALLGPAKRFFGLKNGPCDADADVVADDEHTGYGDDCDTCGADKDNADGYLAAGGDLDPNNWDLQAVQADKEGGAKDGDGDFQGTLAEDGDDEEVKDVADVAPSSKKKNLFVRMLNRVKKNNKNRK